MKKSLTLLLAALIVLSLAACGGNAPTAEKEQPAAEVEQAEPEAAEEAEAPAEEAPEEETPEEEPAKEASDTASANGYTVKIVAVHKTVDSNGDPLGAVELEFTNDNSEPISFMGVAQVTVYQNGIQMFSEEMFLDNNYDWDSYYTNIKDGATIPVFTAVPLQSDDPVEVEVSIIDYNTWEVVASAQIETELVD